MLVCKKRGDTATVFLSGDIDHSAAENTRAELDAAIADGKIRRLVLDLGGVTFMDSSGLGVIMGRYRQLTRRSGSVAVRNVPESADRIFAMSGMYTIIEKL